MKILGLRVDGLRKLTAVEMEFADKGLIQFRGKNKQGKTTILDSFEILLKGAKYIEDDMITHDRKKAEIIGTIGNYEIKRVITSKSTRLEVKHKAGDVLAKPQEFLDTLINELTFNPRPFLNKSAEQKLRFMMDFLNIDFTVVDGKIKNAEDERLIIGRLIKRYGELTPVEKVERVSVSDLVQKRDDIINENNSRKEEYQQDIDDEREKIRAFNYDMTERKRVRDEKQLEIKLMNERKAGIEQELRELLIDLGNAEGLLGEMPEPKPEKSYEVEIEMPVLESTKETDDQIEQAEETNLAADAYNRYANLKKEKAEEERKYEDYTTKLEKFRNVKKMIFRNAKIPIEGLEIREDGVYHDSIHSENWSEAEGLRISAELCLSMAPKLSAIFIDDGETYDVDGLKALQEWAIKNDLQAFITIVDSVTGKSGEGVFYIEEGSIV